MPTPPPHRTFRISAGKHTLFDFVIASFAASRTVHQAIGADAYIDL